MTTDNARRPASVSEDSGVQGTVAPGFEGVRAAFADNFVRHGEAGASFAVYRDGMPVVDLRGGVADIDTGRPWTTDTVGLVYSATKGAAALVVHLLADRGELELDSPVATYWPEFAAQGKGAITVAQLLSHQAGLCVPTVPLTRDELLAAYPVTEALAAQKPIWEPGTQAGYHALTFGWLVGELVRRVSGHSLGTVFAKEIAAPLGLDFWIGLPEERVDAVARLVDPVRDPSVIERITDPAVKTRVLTMAAAMMDPNSLLARTLSTNGALPTPSAEAWNDSAIYTAEQPAANGITNGRSLARLYAASLGPVDGVRLLSDRALEQARRERVRGADAVLIAESRFSAGFQLPLPGAPLLGEGSFGHSGAGGALGFADVDARVGFGYVPNQLVVSPLGDPRTQNLIAALQGALAM